MPDALVLVSSSRVGVIAEISSRVTVLAENECSSCVANVLVLREEKKQSIWVVGIAVL